MGFDWPNPNCFVVLAVVVMKGGGDEVSYLVDIKGRLNLRDGLVQPSLQGADVDWVTDSSCHCELFPFLTLRAAVQTRLAKQSGVVFIEVDIQPPSSTWYPGLDSSNKYPRHRYLRLAGALGLRSCSEHKHQ